jgi:hypothetical protein
LLAACLVLAWRQLARVQREAGDLGRLREQPPEVSQDDTAW